MKRRTLVIGLGAAAAGNTALVGSGAFSSVQAERSVDVDVAGDEDAYLALAPSEGPNGAYAEVTDGTLALRFDGTAEGVDGEGFNPNATTRVESVFTVTNQGTQRVGFYVEAFDTAEDVTVDFLAENGESATVIGEGNAVGLPVGESVPVGLTVDVDGAGPEDGKDVIADDTITLVATVDEDDAPEITETFHAFDTTEDELFEFEYEVEETTDDVDRIDLSFGEDVEPTTSEDLTLRDADGGIRRRNGRQYTGDPARVVLRGTQDFDTEGAESVVIDTVPAGLGDDDGPDPQSATLRNNDGNELTEVTEFDPNGFAESQRLRVEDLDFAELEGGEIDLDEIELTYPEETEFDGVDNGDFNVTHIDGEREPLRVNNPNGSTFEGRTALLDISGSGFENSFAGGTLEIVVNTDAAEAVEPGDITLTLSDTDQGVVREFTASFDD